MKVHEYLKTVEEQIRCKSIWEDIRTELLGHIERIRNIPEKGNEREEAVEGPWRRWRPGGDGD